jgi:hypothetical protein
VFAGLLNRSATPRRVTIQNKTTRPFNIFSACWNTIPACQPDCDLSAAIQIQQCPLQPWLEHVFTIHAEDVSRRQWKRRWHLDAGEIRNGEQQRDTRALSLHGVYLLNSTIPVRESRIVCQSFNASSSALPPRQAATNPSSPAESNPHPFWSSSSKASPDRSRSTFDFV